MTISNLKNYNKVSRPTSLYDEDGNRLYEEFKFETPYSTYTSNDYSLRALAKFIDFLPWILIYHYLFIQSFENLFYSTISMILFNTMCEHLTGFTLGKLILRMKVVNDNAKNPSFLQSLWRNLLSPLNLISSFSSSIFLFIEMIFPKLKELNEQRSNNILTMNMELNNIICKTYTIRLEKLRDVRKLMASQNV